MRFNRKAIAADVVRPDTDLKRMRAACPYLFLILCLASALFQAWNLPPYQGADELAHSYRVDLGTFGQLTAERVKKRATVAGGSTDMSLYEAHLPFNSIRFHPEEKADIVDFTKAGESRWDGRTTRTGYPGSAIYPPFFYMPQSGGMALGKLLDLPVVQSMYLARAANALVCSLIGFAALLIAGRARLLMFSVLLLPMSVSLYATLSNDGLLIVTTALGCAVISRGMHEGRPLRKIEVIAATTCFALVGATKLPYGLFGLVLLTCDMEVRRWRYIATAAALGVSIGWTLWMTFAVQTALTAPGLGIDPALQIQYLLGHPLSVIPIALKTLHNNTDPYRHMFIGVLGWLDTALPETYHRAAWTVLTLSVVWSMSYGREPAWRWTSWTAALLIVMVFGAVHGALYVTWNIVGADYVQGVQGRYFLPLALFACLLVEGRQPWLPAGRANEWVYKAVAAIILAFPLISLLIVERAIITRYYLD